MATLQKIRNRAGIAIAIFIGMALAAFILGDLFKSSSSIMRGKQMELAEIDGKSVTYPEFQAKVEELSEIYKMNSGKTTLDQKVTEQIKEQTWQSMVRNLTMKDIYENLGIGVSSTELFDLVQGKNPHAIIQNIFRDQNTGTINRGALIQFLKYQQTNAGSKEHNYWLFVENQIIEERSFSKYNNLLAKGIYITSDESKSDLKGRNHKANIQVATKLFSSVSDESVKATESELKAYYDNHQDKFKQENNRNIEYVSFPVVASKADEDKLIKWTNDIKAEFSTVEDPANFVNINSDVPFDPSFFKKGELAPEIGNFAFSGKVGDIYGPYKDNKSWKLAKIQRFEELPDSVQARHILIKVNSAPELTKATATIDSIKNLIVVKGQKFEDIARTKSQDKGSAIAGGNLGWIRRGAMVKPFEEAVFFGKLNDLQVVKTQFGIHLVQVTGRGKTLPNVQLAIIDRVIEPSSQTYQATYTQASKFASSNQDLKKFSDAIVAQGLNKKSANVRENDKDVPGLENSRLLIRAAYKAKTGSIIASTEGTPIFELGNQFVIAFLTGEQEKGVASLNTVKARVEIEVRKEKKAQQLIEKMSGKSDLNQLVSGVGATLSDAKDISFETYSIPGVGFEPAVAGAATALESNQVSKPVAGTNGVYVVKVNSVTTGTDQDLAANKLKLAASISYRANMYAFEALRENAKIVDKRAKFY
ncbi:MAG: SurA N-terminal domain-containing protein [Mariniphaga sp.]